MVTIVAAGMTSFALLGTFYVIFFALLGQHMKPRQTKPPHAREPRTRFLVLVPARNEEGGIRPTLLSCRGLDYPHHLCRVVVIADNCQDNTAAVVREEGLECWIRKAPRAPGKGYALRWALDRARDIEFDAVVFIDADTTVDPQILRVFDHELARGAQALQARYDFECGDTRGFSLFTSASKRAESKLIWRPRQELGLVVFLQGNGFCLGRDVLRAVPWTAHSITEDVEFSLELALHGIRVDFLESTHVVSRLTGSAGAAFPQRLRWASGTLQVTLRSLPRVLTAALKQRSWRPAEAGIALLLSSRPVLAYLTLLALGVSFLGLTPPVAVVVRAGISMAVILQFIYLVCVMCTVVKDRKDWLSLFGLPAYMGWLLFVQFMAALGMKRKVWARTAR